MSTIAPIPLVINHLPDHFQADSGYTARVSFFGDRVRAFRKKRGWTQVDLAEKAGLDKQTIFRIEKGGNSRHGTSAKLATALGVPLGQLIDEPRPKRTGHAETDVQAALWNYPALSDHLGELLKGIGRMQPKDRAAFLRGLIALFSAFEHTRPAASGGTHEDDGH